VFKKTHTCKKADGNHTVKKKLGRTAEELPLAPRSRKGEEGAVQERSQDQRQEEGPPLHKKVRGGKSPELHPGLYVQTTEPISSEGVDRGNGKNDRELPRKRFTLEKEGSRSSSRLVTRGSIQNFFWLPVQEKGKQDMGRADNLKTE